MFTYHDLIDRMDGFTIGTLVIENDTIALQTDDDDLLPLPAVAHIEVMNDRAYLRVTYAEALEMRDPATGWHTLAGVYARVK